ncbi:Holliday junction branch migration protein RuvA [Candidatus Gracilibacteria bacterium]|nr:Holliday junction branch migration protein RuvA [Candidatus Gracilibacteria bacterium]
MIHYLSGTILSRQDNLLLIVTNSIGYEVLVPRHYHFMPGEAIILFIHPHLTSDNYQLFGFSSQAEKQWFLILTNISGIGPKTGLNILASGIDSLHQALLKQDKHFFENISGIGKKTALKILIELAENPHLPTLLPSSRPHADAHATLLNLGYDPTVVEDLLKDIPKDVSSGQAVTLALQKYAQNHQR